ncbi:hypothetical protein ETB97_009425 [Aspergillus alliaceus]|uniref:Uncharacterized protein n=1 Tax=Petromyces alliaceus TaxID=209559 RepID=A0A8H6EAH5_PETAA|nr:hypothetical protein ETB97_009425 [Aspergillus burnettii]
MLSNLNTSQKALYWLLIQATLLSQILARQCYWRDGMPALSELQPCFPEKENSACCATKKTNGDPNDICTESGLCIAQVSPYAGQVLRDGCTDSSWKSSDCPNMCPDSMRGEYGLHILPCPDISLRHWCCSDNGSNCCDNAFKLDIGTMILPTALSSSVVPSAAATVTATTTATVTPGTTSEPTCDGACHADTTTVAVGVGVGAGLGACLMATVFMLCFQRRTYQKKLRDIGKVTHWGHSPGVQQCGGPLVAVHPVELPPGREPVVHEIDSGYQER